MKIINASQIKDLLFFAVILVLAILTFFIFKPFLGIIVIGLVLVELCNPLYYFILKRIKSKSLASAISTIIILLLVITPISLVILSAGNEAFTLKDTIQKYITDNQLFANNGIEITNRLNLFLHKLSVNYEINDINYEQIILSFMSKVIGTASSVINLLKNTINIIIEITLLIYTLFYLFKEHGNLRFAFKQISPLDDDMDELFINKFNLISKSIIKGSLIVGLVQGISGGVAFWLLGIDAPIFWTLMMTLLSILPLGSGFIWAPAALILILTGSVTKGILLLLWGTIFITNIDNYLRAKTLGKDTSIHPLVSFFSIIGGIQLFGILGLIYGPLIVILFLALYQAYKQKYNLK